MPGQLRILHQAAAGLGYTAKTRVMVFLDQLERRFQLLHPYTGKAWLDWYEHAARQVLAHVDREPLGAAKIIYNHVIGAVVAPSQGQLTSDAEVTQSLERVRDEWHHLADHYGVTAQLPPPPPPELAARLRAMQGRPV